MKHVGSIERTMKARRTYKKIKIFLVKNMIPGSDIKELKDGRIVDVAPKYDVLYRWTNGALCYTLAEIKADIDAFFKLCGSCGIEPEMVVETLNQE